MKRLNRSSAKICYAIRINWRGVANELADRHSPGIDQILDIRFALLQMQMNRKSAENPGDDHVGNLDSNSCADTPPSVCATQAKRRLTMHYLLIYDLVPDYLERRGAYRETHLKLAWAAAERGELELAGALTEPVDTAVLLFEGDSPAAAEAFARADPYVLAGLAASWRVRQWITVVGEGAANPVH
jgi:uncharacterized protein YciI